MTTEQAAAAAKIRKALEAGPTEGPWFTPTERLGFAVATIGKARICSDMPPKSDSAADLAYIAACDPATIRTILAALDAAQATVAKWETTLSAVMPADFTDWHENSRTEWPELAAWVIVNLREREAEAWKHVDRIVARGQDIPAPDDPPIPDPREETKRALIAWATAYARKVAAAQAAAQAPRDVPRLTEPDMVACLVASSCVGTVKMSYDSGPYEITRTSINADRLCRAVEARVRELCGVAP